MSSPTKKDPAAKAAAAAGSEDAPASDGGDGAQQPKDQNRVRAKATGDLDKVTDYVEEREMDSSKVADSMRAMLGKTPTASQRRAAELAGVKIANADVDIIMTELDVERRVAEHALRVARGDVVEALCALVA